jgi:hypothetical protein
MMSGFLLLNPLVPSKKPLMMSGRSAAHAGPECWWELLAAIAAEI